MSPVKHIKPGLTREWLDDGRIAGFVLGDMSTDTVDGWVAACLDVMRDCVKKQRPVLILQDLSGPGVMQTLSLIHI